LLAKSLFVSGFPALLVAYQSYRGLPFRKELPSYGFNNGIRFFLQRLLKERCSVVGDGSGGFAKHASDDSIKGYVTHREGILKPIFFTASTGTQYSLVDSIHTSKQLLSISHCLNWRIELLKV
jgi:hypothetical protein